MNIPDKCKDCTFFRIDIDINKNTYKCMLNHNLELAQGCPNKKKINEYS